ERPERRGTQQGLPLPGGIVSVLHRKHRADVLALVGRGQLTGKYGDGPAIGRDVVHHQHEDVFVFAEADQGGAEHAIPLQIEGTPQLVAEQVQRTLRRVSLGDQESHGTGRLNLLPRFSILDYIVCSQNFMPGGDPVQSLLKDVRLQASMEMKGPWDM